MPQLKLDIGFGITESIPVPLHVLLCNLKLLFCHIHTDYRTLLSHQLRQQITVTARTTTQIQYPGAFQLLWCNQTTSVVACRYLGMYVGHGVFKMSR